MASGAYCVVRSGRTCLYYLYVVLLWSNIAWKRPDISALTVCCCLESHNGQVLSHRCKFQVVTRLHWQVKCHQKLMEAQLEVGSGGQFSPSVWPHNPATGFRPPSATVVSAEPFSHGTGTLRCLQKEMATYRHWSVSLWWDPDDVSHCRILSPDKTRLHSADEDAVSWLTSYGSWHAYEKKIGKSQACHKSYNCGLSHSHCVPSSSLAYHSVISSWVQPDKSRLICIVLS